MSKRTIQGLTTRDTSIKYLAPEKKTEWVAEREKVELNSSSEQRRMDPGPEL